MGVVSRRFVLLLFAGVVSIPGVGCGSEAARRPGKLRVVATFSILGDLVKHVADDEADVVTLVGPDGDAHTFEPTPTDGVAVAEADILFENGAGLEGWLDKLYKSSGSRGQRVTVTDGLKLREAEQDHEKDPHVWHDVQNAIHMVEVIRDHLVQADPDHAGQYRANASSYLARLHSLHRWVEEAAGTLPPERRKLVTSHDTFGYFAGRYGFEITGTALASFSTETADPRRPSSLNWWSRSKPPKYPPSSRRTSTTRS
jgi:zinc/manganese transport system substrate-binding protein